MKAQHLSLLSALAFFSSLPASANTPIWQCSPAPGETVQVFSEREVPRDHFGRLQLVAGDSVTVAVSVKDVHSQPDGERSYSALVLRVDNSGGVTKHGTMARYELARGSLPRSLTLQLLGIDEFENRERCAWSDNK